MIVESSETSSLPKLAIVAGGQRVGQGGSEQPYIEEGHRSKGKTSPSVRALNQSFEVGAMRIGETVDVNPVANDYQPMPRLAF